MARDFRHQTHLLAPVSAFFSEATAPEVRWLVQRSARALPIDLPKFTTLNGLFWAMDIHLDFAAPPHTAGWDFLLTHSEFLRSVTKRKDVFRPRDEDWPLKHPVLDVCAPCVWAGSYHPPQLRRSPLLTSFPHLDALTAWAMNMTDEIDVKATAHELDLALTLPGFRIWAERINVLPALIPFGQDAPTVMETRFEILDAPLRDPTLERDLSRRAFRDDLDLDDLPRFPHTSIPYSNAKAWAMLASRPRNRWTLATHTRRDPKDLNGWRRQVPYLEPTGKKAEVMVGDVYFRSLFSACRFFRLPYETIKSRVNRGMPIETALEINPMWFGHAAAPRRTTYPSHWHRNYARSDSKWTEETE